MAKLTNGRYESMYLLECFIKLALRLGNDCFKALFEVILYGHPSRKTEGSSSKKSGPKMMPKIAASTWDGMGGMLK